MLTWIKYKFLEWFAAKTFDTFLDKGRKLLGWCDKSQKPVLIIGPGGVGKSTFARMLTANPIPVESDYVESSSTETQKLKDDPRIEVVIPPGQEHRRNSTWNELLDQVANGEFRGVVVVLAYGYHSIGDVDLRLLPGYSKDDLSELVLHRQIERLGDELSASQKIAVAIGRCRTPIWWLTLVTKEDLWWDESLDVKRHYVTSDYLALSKIALGDKSPRDFRYEIAYSSLRIRNFDTSNGMTVKKSCAGYDQKKQRESIKRLEQTFDGLVKWENTKNVW